MTKQAPLVIIGTGVAAYLLAKAWRRYDSKTPLVMVSMDNGAFYSKPQLSVSLSRGRSATDIMTADACCMAEELSAHILTYTVVQAIEPDAHRIHCAPVSAESGSFSGAITYRRLVLACGARPRTLSLDPAFAQDVMSINSLVDYDAFSTWMSGRQHLAIIGSGLVGIEFAHDLSKMGVQTTVISLDHYPLQTFIPAEIAGIGQRVRQRLTDRCGINWHFGVKLDAITRVTNGGRLCLHLSDGRVLETDGLLSAIGLEANLDLAKAAGLETRRGIVVSGHLQTSVPDIYAIGDCAEMKGDWRCFIAPIRYCSEVLAAHLAGEITQAVCYPPMLVKLKTMTYPLSFCLPCEKKGGTWSLVEGGDDVRANCHDQEKRLRGFMLTGALVKEGMGLLGQLRATT